MDIERTLASFAVFFLFIVRCLVPVIVLLGISYFLKKLGLIKEPHTRNMDFRDNIGETNLKGSDEGGVLNGSL